MPNMSKHGCQPCQGPRQASSQGPRQEQGSGVFGDTLLWALGGVALAGLAGFGVAALVDFLNEDNPRLSANTPDARPSPSNHDTRPRPTPSVTLVEEHYKENISEIFLTRDLAKEICGICQEPVFTEADGTCKPCRPLYILRCNHVFHRNCLEQWLQQKERNNECPDCPTCKCPDPTNLTGRKTHPYCDQC